MKTRCLAALLSVALLWQARAWSQPLPPGHHKHRTVQAVCQRIAATFGTHQPLPNLKIWPGMRTAAAQLVLQPQPELWLDERLYDLCQAFGPDSLHALACVVGHELAHYYLGHTPNAGLAGNPGLPSAQEGEKQKMEAEADEQGIFHAYLAGYDAPRMVERVFVKIYELYRLPDKMPGYPARQQRIEAAQRKARRTQQMAHIWETGKFLYLKKDLVSAQRCFAHILSAFPTKEVFNNVAACALAQAVSLSDSAEMYFAYPFEIDANNRLRNGNLRSAGHETDRRQRAELLQSAREHAEKALQLDKSYAPAAISLAAALSLQNRPAFAVEIIRDLEQNSGGLPANAHLMRGIALVKCGRAAAARADFEQARRQQAFMHAYNCALYENLQKGSLQNIWEWVGGYFTGKNAVRPLATPSVQTAKPDAAFTNATFRSEWTARIPEPHPVHISVQAGPNTTDFCIKTESQHIFMRQSGGLAVPLKVAALHKRHGPASRQVAAGGGAVFYCYDQARLMAETKNGLVVRWIAYRVTF